MSSNTRAADVVLAENLLGGWVRFTHRPKDVPRRVIAVTWEGMVELDGHVGHFAAHLFTLVSKTDRALSLLEEYVAMFPAFRTKPIGALGSEQRAQQERHISLEDRAKRLLDPNPNLEG